MKKVNMFEIGEEVLIKATVSDIIVENGELKYHIKAEHSNNDLDHRFTEHQIIPFANVLMDMDNELWEQCEEEDEKES